MSPRTFWTCSPSGRCRGSSARCESARTRQHRARALLSGRDTARSRNLRLGASAGTVVCPYLGRTTPAGARCCAPIRAPELLRHRPESRVKRIENSWPDMDGDGPAAGTGAAWRPPGRSWAQPGRGSPCLPSRNALYGKLGRPSPRRPATGPPRLADTATSGEAPADPSERGGRAAHPLAGSFSTFVTHTSPFLSSVRFRRSFLVRPKCFTSHAGMVVLSDSAPDRTG